VTDLTGKSSYSKEVDKVEEYKYTISAIDKAGNKYEVDETITVPDIFIPKINSIYVKSRNSKYSIEFEIEDENLDFYRITQKSLSITEDISGKTYSGIVPYEYEGGTILFKVQDTAGNYVERTINLNSKIDYDIEDYYTAKKRFEIESDANKCYLVNFMNKSFNTEFEKDSDEFHTDLDIYTDGEYEIEFRCIKSNFEEYFTENFYYDSTPPQKPLIGIEKLDNGDMKVSWSKVKDDSGSDVKYYLYKNNEMIMLSDGDKLSFTDNLVQYPNSYSYYLEVKDEAGNIILTETKSEVPNKIKINFSTNLEKTQSVANNIFSVPITAEKSSNLYIVVLNKGVITDQQIVFFQD
jgi:hypothetical protein